MKKEVLFFLVFVISFLFIKLVIATYPSNSWERQCSCQGSTLACALCDGNNLNVTDYVFADDFRYPNGSSCCSGGVASDGNTNCSVAGTCSDIVYYSTVDFGNYWIDNGSFMQPNVTIASNIYVPGYVNTSTYFCINQSCVSDWSQVNQSGLTYQEIANDYYNKTESDAKYAPIGSSSSNDNLSFGVIRGFTNTTLNGDWDNASHIGYIRGHTICNDEYNGSHVCSCEEIGKFHSYNYTNLGEQVWCLEFAPGFNAAANDCEGHTKSVNEIASFWDYTEGSGVGAAKLTVCTSTLKLACCGDSR